MMWWNTEHYRRYAKMFWHLQYYPVVSPLVHRDPHAPFIRDLVCFAECEI